MKIDQYSVNFVREPLKSPFGFKGNYVNELWNTAVSLYADGLNAVGLGVQSPLWADADIFSQHVPLGSNALMFAITEYAAKLTLDKEITVNEDDLIYPGEGAQNGLPVYSTLVLGANAYGVTELENGGLEHIVKQLGSAGTADPLNQRASAGWKATKTAERLVENYMIRIESCSSFADEYAN